MYEVKGKTVTFNVESLDAALKVAKAMNEIVTIKSKEYEIVGIFGADEIVNGLTPDGYEYDWVKRR
jgi:transcriptional/translational regulatory protein YebC/TACO1